MNKLALTMSITALVLAVAIPIAISYEHSVVLAKNSVVSHKPQSNIYCENGVMNLSTISSRGIGTSQAIVIDNKFITCESWGKLIESPVTG